MKVNRRRAVFSAEIVDSFDGAGRRSTLVASAFLHHDIRSSTLPWYWFARDDFHVLY